MIIQVKHNDDDGDDYDCDDDSDDDDCDDDGGDVVRADDGIPPAATSWCRGPRALVKAANICVR